jgi:diguanylate cyclase (GGDEF)-like protein
MWSAIAAACAALVIVAAAVLSARRTSARSERAFERAIEKLDEHLGTISLALGQGIAQGSDARQQDLEDLGLTLDLGELLDHLLTKAAVLTGGQLVAIRVKGPGGIPLARSLGAGDGSALLSAALGSPGIAQFAAMTVGWTYAADERSPEAYRSALVVPIVEDGVETGAIASYALAPDTFLPEHVRALQLLVAESASGLRNARRFAEVERRTVIDALTGVRNRAGYEFELDREIARARRTGRPLSLAVFAVAPSPPIEERSSTAEADLVLRDFAAALARVARATDIPCRRDESQFAILLPETKNEGAGRLCARVQAEAAANVRSHVGGPLTLTAGVVEW